MMVTAANCPLPNRPMHRVLPLAFSLFCALLLSIPAPAGELSLVRLNASFSQPLWATSPPGDHDRLFVLQRTGSVRIYKKSTGSLVSQPFIDLGADGFSQCYSLVFHPDYAANGYFYVIGIVVATGDVTVRRYSVSDDNPDTADPGSRFDIITTMPDGSHNGGWLGFSPTDGTLHITTGDGSTSPLHDPENDSQNRDNLIGKLLRIDVSGDDFPEDDTRNYRVPPDNPYASGGGSPEIRSIGLRNPWRASFDRETGDLWIADVGQNAREEINVIADGDLTEKNFGWRLREGTIATPSGGVGGDRPSANIDPIFEYGPIGQQSITGGYVYRGSALPWLVGTYLYGDFMTNEIGSLRYEGGGITDATDLTQDLVPNVGTLSSLVSFGEDAAGELYIVGLSGSVFMITRPYLVWLRQHIPVSGQDGADEDPDGDGLATVFEYVIGTSPTNPSGEAGAEAFEYFLAEGGLPTVRIHRDASATDVTLKLQTSSDLLNWSEEMTTVLSDTAELFEARDDVPVSQRRRFLRVLASLE